MWSLRLQKIHSRLYILQLLNLPGASWNLLSSNTNLLNLCQNHPASINLPKTIPVALTALVTSKCKEHKVECSHLDSLCFSKCKYKLNPRLFYISDFRCLNTLLSSPPQPPQFIQRDGIFSTQICARSWVTTTSDIHLRQIEQRGWMGGDALVVPKIQIGRLNGWCGDG